MPHIAGMLASIPSPSSNGLTLGPLHLRAYGLLIAFGVFAAVWLADRRWRARGGLPGTLTSIAVWAVPGGLIGARIYHIITDYELYTHAPLDMLKIWKGGLGIWGGVAGGVLVGWIYIRRQHLDFRGILDCVAPALPLAQAIGRVGNYFNQELYGRPSKLPWALRIDNPQGYPPGTTFHPIFLYELLWDLVVVGMLLWAEKRFRLRKGYLFVLYVALYTFGRFFTEYLRIDFAHKFAGLRLNDWTSLVIFAVAAAVLARSGRPDGVEAAASGDAGTGSARLTARPEAAPGAAPELVDPPPMPVTPTGPEPEPTGPPPPPTPEPAEPPKVAGPEPEPMPELIPEPIPSVAPAPVEPQPVATVAPAPVESEPVASVAPAPVESEPIFMPPIAPAEPEPLAVQPQAEPGVVDAGPETPAPASPRPAPADEDEVHQSSGAPAQPHERPADPAPPT